MRTEISGFRILQFQDIPVFLWIAEISDYHCISKWLEVLDVSEIARYESFKFVVDAQKFAARRFFVRLCMNSIGCFDLNQDSFRYLENGKPFLQNHECHLSWAASKGYIAVAASKISPVGIDIEYIDKNFDFEPLWTLVYGNDDCDKKHENFFRFWTAREAIAKLTGTGLNEDIMKLKMKLSKSDKKVTCIDTNKFNITQFKKTGFLISIANYS